MRLIIIAEEAVYEHDVDPSMEVQDITALVESETGTTSTRFTLSTDAGDPLALPSRSLESYGLKGDTATIFLTESPNPSNQAGSSSARQPTDPTSDEEYNRMRLQVLGNPNLMAQLRQSDPDMARAVQKGPREFAVELVRQKERMQAAAREKKRQEALLNEDPYDIEAQKKIEEAIRLERVEENMAHAYEYAPETFANVVMLYVNLEINGHPVKAFVDSGAQRTIISPRCAEACGIMRLIDTRFAGVAVGVGTGRILGRIHSAQIKLGNLFLPCSFTVLEGKGVDLLFGLDMLKRFQCSIDLAANVLRLQSTEIPFLPEHELPDDGLQQAIEAAGEPTVASSDLSPSANQHPASGSGPSSFPGGGRMLGTPTIASGSAPSGSSASSSTRGRAPVGATDDAREGKVKEDDVQTLMGLGAERQQAIALLEAAGGNVDYAASMLFGGGAQWP